MCDLSRDAVSRDEEINVFVACYINPAEDAVAQFDSFQLYLYRFCCVSGCLQKDRISPKQ